MVFVIGLCFMQLLRATRQDRWVMLCVWSVSFVFFDFC